MFSVEYYFEKVEVDTSIDNETPTIDLPGFVYETTENGFHRFRNTAYVPMGFTFTHYVSEDVWNGVAENQRANLLMRALVLTDEQAEKYGADIQPISSDDVRMSESDYLTECANRADSACDSFVYDSDGFNASISLDNPNLVFFSVPYDDGWSASVNGKPVDIEQVDSGFMAVPAEAGENEIVFTYKTPGLHAGLWISLGGILLFVGYMAVCWKFVKRVPKEKCVSCIDYADSAELALDTANESKTENPDAAT